MAKEQLSYAAVDKAKPSSKDIKLTDGGGLYLLIKKNGSKYWRYDYRYQGKRKTMALGVYPEVSLKAAREAHRAAREHLANNIDPSGAKQTAKFEDLLADKNCFSAVAKEWWEHQKGTWTAHHAGRIWRRFEQDVFPYIGNLNLEAITSQDVIQVVRRIESRGALDVANRVLIDIKRAFSYAIILGRTTINPASDLTGALKSRKLEHRPSLPRNELPQFLKDLDEYPLQGRKLTQIALKLLLLTFLRSAEVRGARWEEFDFENKLWRIPGVRLDANGKSYGGMKMKTEHIVPLSKQTLSLLNELKPISGQYDLLFPSERNRNQPISDNTMRLAMFRMGYDGKTPGKSKAVPHGFRNTASSILNEEGFNPDAIERQLSHMERNGVRAAYTHHARYMEERTRMMQWWADYLDKAYQAGT